jgi:hypothetical protein
MESLDSEGPLKRIAPFVFIAFAAIGLLGTPSTAFALPPCPEDQNVVWDERGQLKFLDGGF